MSASGSQAAPGPEPPQSRRGRIARRAGLVALGTLLSRVVGLGRELIVAALFPRAITDAFFIAFQIPNILRQLLAEGAVQNAVIPVLAQVQREEGEERAREYFRNARGLSLCLLTLVSASGIIFADPIVRLFAPGFSQRQGQLAETVQLTRWVFPYIFFIGTAALSGAALNTHRLFFATAFAPILLNVSFVLAAWLLPSLMLAIGQPTTLSLALGALVGGVLQVIALWPGLKRLGYLERPGFRFSDPAVVESLRRMGPTLIGIGVYYLDVIIGRRFLSGLGEGAVTYFGFALRLCDFPQGIFVMALQTATLPSLASLVAAKKHDEVAETLGFSVRVSLLVGLGATGLVLGLAEPIVRMLFERGEFGPNDTVETGKAFMAQGLGIWLAAVIRQVTSVYFALGDTKTPVLVAGLDLCAFVLSAYLLEGQLGHVGVGLAVSFASLVQLGLLWFWLRRRLVLPERAMLRALLQLVPAAGLAGFGAHAFVTLRLGSDSTALDALQTTIATGLGLITYLGLAHAFGVVEVKALVTPLLRRLGVARR